MNDPKNLRSVKKHISDLIGFEITDFIEESESREYEACTFKLDNKSVKFRSAKITPTKIGQFVALWKRNQAGITQPHDDSDPFDLYIINVRKEKLSGQFVFTKQALIEQSILSTSEKEGKRGFRVYPPWDVTANKQAQKTQKWQAEFFYKNG